MKADAGRARVLLVDDHPVVAQGLAGLLEDEGFDVVGIAASVPEAMKQLAGAPTDLAVVDLTLEAGSGLDLLAHLRARHPGVSAVVYSVHEDGDHVRRALAAGAVGFVTKREDPDVLLACLRHVQTGERFLSPRAGRALADAVASGLPTLPEDALSPQELQVFERVGRGFAPQDIAAQMGLSVRTVETYLTRILTKLDLGGRRELRQRAVAWVQRAG